MGTTTRIVLPCVEGDVYRFAYDSAIRCQMFEPDHCFDGQLVCRGGLLVDTYWGFAGAVDGRSFTPKEAREKGTLTFVCNIHNVQSVQDWQFPQYAEEDRFDLSNQHGCYKKFVVRIGARKSVAHQLAIIDKRIRDAREDARYALDRAFRDIESGAEDRKRLESGEDFYV